MKYIIIAVIVFALEALILSLLHIPFQPVRMALGALIGTSIVGIFRGWS
jgi:hypothetical protein